MELLVPRQPRFRRPESERVVQPDGWMIVGEAFVVVSWCVQMESLLRELKATATALISVQYAQSFAENSRVGRTASGA